jgi:hypothetical protein
MNTVRVGTNVYYAGSLMSDANDDLVNIRAVGGKLMPSSTTGLAAAAALATTAKLRGDSDLAESIMNAALDAEQGVPAWGNQATWYIDESNGDDSNDGSTAGSALASWEEFKSRIEANGAWVDMTVNIVGDLTATIVTPATLNATGTGSITLVGAGVTVATGTVNTWTFVPATNDHGTLNDAAWTVATHLRRFVEFTSGAGDGYGCFIAEDLGANSARVSIVHEYTIGFGSTATPAPADTFKVETFPIVRFGTVSFPNFYMKKIETYDWDNWKSLVFYGQNFGAVACRLNVFVQQGYLQITNCIGGISGRGGGGELYAGIYGRLYFDGGRAYTQDGEPVIYDSSVPQTQAMDLGQQGAFTCSWKDFWFMTGTGKPVSLYIENGARFDIGSARIRGNAASTRLMEIYEGGRFLTTQVDHTVVEKTIAVGGEDLELNNALRYGGDPRAVRKMSVTIAEADITAAAATETLNLGAALPANSRILGVDFHTFTPFTGGTIADYTLDLGSAGDPDALIDGADLFAAAVDGGPSAIPQGIRPNKFFSASTQLTAKFDCASDDVADAVAGSITIDVYFAVEA